MAYPRGSSRRPAPPDVPNDIKDDYDEACRVLDLSSKSAAAQARRCLQSVLANHGYKKKNLAEQIDDVLNETDPTKSLPSSLVQTIDAIRNFGNFSAHAITDQTTLQIIDVEEGEAEWCLEILEELFDHYYVKPAKAMARKAALDGKLKKAGKPRSK